MRKPAKDVLQLPIEKRAEIAMKVAVARAIDEHTRLGLPVYVWRNNKVVKLSSARARGSSRPKK
ncbi:MAG TPA: hypothetical protein VFF50_12060 [Candidatus Deferrimicrobiaceae bacterium]|jgi:hypothetical protein|nr:hypothetical protein [Candidatus Deferrimicrobiaceae bacterium]